LTKLKYGRNLKDETERFTIQSYIFPLFRVMEIHRICEVTATP